MNHPHIEPLEARIAPANLAYAFGIGGSKNESVQDVALDGSGNIYVSGTFQGTVDFDPGAAVIARSAPAGLTYGFVAKYTNSGGFAWVNTVQPFSSAVGVTDGTIGAVHLAVSAAGSVFVSTDFTSKRIGIFDTGLSKDTFRVGTDSSLFVGKINSDGFALWATAYGTVNRVDVTEEDIAVDGTSGIYVVGKFKATAGDTTISFTNAPLPALAENDNLYVLKLNDVNAVPTVAWAASTAGPAGSKNVINNALIAVDASGRAGVAGKFGGTLTFATSPATTVTTNADGIFVGRLDTAGGWSFAGNFAPSGPGNNVSGLAIDSSSHLFVAGDFTTATDFDPTSGVSTLNPVSNRNGFLVRLSPTGAPDFTPQNFFSQTNDPVFGGGIAIDSSGDADVVFDNGHPLVRRYQPGGSASNLIEFPELKGKGPFGSIAVDPAGSLYFGGTFTGKADFDPVGSATLSSKGATDGYLAHYFPGALVAQDVQLPYVTKTLTVGSAGEEIGRQVYTDAAGNIYAAGLFKGTADFDPGPGVTNLTSKAGADYNIFVAKYDSAGALLWAKPVLMDYRIVQFASPNVRFAVDTAGNVYLTGEYFGQAAFDAITLTNADTALTDVFVAKLDTTTGAFMWADNLTGPGSSDFVRSIAVLPSAGQLVIGGQFSGTVDFDPSPAGTVIRTPVSGANNGAPDSFILSLDPSNGGFGWVRQIGGSFAADSVNALAFTSTGDVVAAGSFSGTIDFDLGGAGAPLVANSIFMSAYAARFAGNNGSVVWDEKFGGIEQAHGNALAIDASDNIYVGGDFSGSGDFDSRAVSTKFLVSSGQDNTGLLGDAFLVSLAGDGTFQNAVNFGGTGQETVNSLQVSGGNLFAVGTSSAGGDFDPGPGIAKLNPNSAYLARFTSNLGFLAARPLTDNMASVDAAGNVFVTGSIIGTRDLDPSTTAATVKSKGGSDFYIATLAPDGLFDAAHPRTFHDLDGDLVTLRLTGPGTATYSLIGGVQHMADLDQLTLKDTTLATSVNVSVTKFGLGDGASTAQKILTAQPEEHLGSLTVGSKFLLGDGVADTVADLHVSGKLNKLVLGDLQPNFLIRLGDGLPYNVPTDTTTPDTYNNHPDVTIGTVEGAGVQLVLLGADAALSGPNAGIGTGGDAVHGGGGGLGKVIIGSWDYVGFIRTTQSIGDFTVVNSFKTDVTQVVLEIDKFSRGSGTTANTGNMNIGGGGWGSTGSEVEGNIGSFNAAAFLAGATLDAATIGKINVGGPFQGTVNLTGANPDAPGIPTFTVNSDFAGSVVSTSPIKKLKIKGDFTGSLTAPFIGSITAYSFIGTTGALGYGKIEVTGNGSLGTLVATHGGITDYKLITTKVFSGIKVALTGLNSVASDTVVGLKNVDITAASIGNISVSLTAAKDTTATGLKLIGILNSTFTTTGTGTTKSTAGSIGSIAVAINGSKLGAASTGIKDSTVDALVGSATAQPVGRINALGNVSVKLSGQAGTNLGLSNVTFAANNIGSTAVSVTRSTLAASTGTAVNVAKYTASGAIGAISLSGNATGDQATGVKVWAGHNVAGVTVKSTDPGGAHGTLTNSSILAGQLLATTFADLATQKRELGLAKLGAISVSGSLNNTDLVAGGSIGAVAAGRSMTDSLVLAGARLGGENDFTFTGNETYQRAASIASITVKDPSPADFARNSIVAGVNPGGDFSFGNTDIAATSAFASDTSRIGPIVLAAGTTGTAVVTTHQYAIEAAAITSLKVGPLKSVVTSPLFLDLTTPGDEPSDILIRLL